MGYITPIVLWSAGKEESKRPHNVALSGHSPNWLEGGCVSMDMWRISSPRTPIRVHTLSLGTPSLT